MNSGSGDHFCSIVLTEMQLQRFFIKIAQYVGEELDSEDLLSLLLGSVDEVKRFHDAWEKGKVASRGGISVIVPMGIEYEFRDVSREGTMN